MGLRSRLMDPSSSAALMAWVRVCTVPGFCSHDSMSGRDEGF